MVYMNLTKKIIHITLASRVLAVAVINYKDDGELFDWAVHIDAVPGRDHNSEKYCVAGLGDKTSKELGAFLFPKLDVDKFRE